MSIDPLPVFEADADAHHRSALTDEEQRERIQAPDSLVIRVGKMGLIAEYAHDGDLTPVCGMKLVARTHRGVELVEMVTTTCENSGCGKTVNAEDMRNFIEKSGGREFPMFTNGRILRAATTEDLNKQSALDSSKSEYLTSCKDLIKELDLDMKLVEVEPILGGELLTYYYMAADRVDFRELVRRLAGEMKTRIEMRQVGARDEARLVADYERCGQYCCCKSFLKVLKPVSMKSAKLQKATLDPLKISGRCGRLMCCLRYEDQTYRDLRERLPKRNTRVGTAEGPGIVVGGRVIVQLALVKLEHDRKEIAVPVDELMDPETCPKPGEAEVGADPLRGMPESRVFEETPKEGAPGEQQRQQKKKRRSRRRKRKPKAEGGEAAGKTRPSSGEAGSKKNSPASGGDKAAEVQAKPKRKRSRRRRRSRTRQGDGEKAGQKNDQGGGA